MCINNLSWVKHKENCAREGACISDTVITVPPDLRKLQWNFLKFMKFFKIIEKNERFHSHDESQSYILAQASAVYDYTRTFVTGLQACKLL